MKRVCLAILAAAGLCVAADGPNLTEQYRSVADKLIDAALADNEGYDRLTYLCYRIGNRLSGSTGLEKAVAWSAEQMKAAGLSNVRILPVKVPHWVRGTESARMLTPMDRPLHMLGLGSSIGTPPGGITAEVVAVSDFSELARLGKAKIQGKIVVYNEPYAVTDRLACTARPEPRVPRPLAPSHPWCARRLPWRCRFHTPGR